MDIAKHFAKNFFSARIGGQDFENSNKIYKFEKIKRAKLAAVQKQPERIILDMGVGEPDAMADQSAIKILYKEASKFENRTYADNGCYELKLATSHYMQQMFNVSLDPNEEILHSIGSKAALSILPLCFVNPGDIVITTVPGYAIFSTHAQYLGANIIKLPLVESNNFLPQLETLSNDVLKRTKVVILNYPNNPTGATCTHDFFSRIIELAHQYSFLVINDAAYSGLTFNKTDRLSILQIDGAKDVALELHSMSKGFNMTGWRIGWVCGNKYLINAYGNVKDNTDSGQFLPIQKAAAHILADITIPQNNAKRYSERMDKVIKIFNSRGFHFSKPKAGFYIYSSSPQKVIKQQQIFSFSSAEEFSEWMIKELGIISVPWDDAEHAIRLSMTFTTSTTDEKQALDILAQRLLDVKFVF